MISRLYALHFAFPFSFWLVLLWQCRSFQPSRCGGLRLFREVSCCVFLSLFDSLGHTLKRGVKIRELSQGLLFTHGAHAASNDCLTAQSITCGARLQVKFCADTNSASTPEYLSTRGCLWRYLLTCYSSPVVHLLIICNVQLHGGSE